MGQTTIINGGGAQQGGCGCPTATGATGSNVTVVNSGSHFPFFPWDNGDTTVISGAGGCAASGAPAVIETQG